MSYRNSRQIGILGGSFDPVHNGHMELARCAMEECGLDEVWFLPARHQPFKFQKGQTGIAERLEMLELAIKNMPAFRVCDLEARRNRVSYTYETMEELCSLYPQHFFHFILGADSLSDFPKWRYPERIASCVPLIVAVREGFDRRQLEEQKEFLQSRFAVRIRTLEMQEVIVSSSGIRKKLENGTLCGGDIPDGVYEFIMEKGLYQGNRA